MNGWNAEHHEWDRICQRVRLRGAIPMHAILCRSQTDGAVVIRFIAEVVDINPPHERIEIETIRYAPPPALAKTEYDRLNWMRSIFVEMYRHEVSEQFHVASEGGKEERPFAPHDDER